MNGKKSKGIVFFAGVNILIGLLLLIASILFILKGFPVRGPVVIIPAAACLIFSLTYTIVGIRTLRLIPKARKENIILALFFFFPGLVIYALAVLVYPSFFDNRDIMPGFFITCTIWFMIVLFYFSSQKVKEQFQYKNRLAPSSNKKILANLLKILLCIFLVFVILTVVLPNLLRRPGNELFKFASMKNPPIQKVEKLLQKGAKVNVYSRDGYTPLLFAIENDNNELAKLFLEYEADPEMGRIPPLLAAARKGNRELIELLIEKGAEVNKRLEWGSYILTEVVKRGDIAPLQLLISKGADVNVITTGGTTVLATLRNSIARPYLSKANKEDYLKIEEILISNGAKELSYKDVVKQKERFDINIIDAAKENNLEVLKLLIAGGEDVNAKGKKGKTALGKAVDNRNYEMVKFLIDNGADVNSDRNALYSAIHKNNYKKEIAQLLLEGGANINVPVCIYNTRLDDREVAIKTTPLIYAVLEDNAELVNLLLENGADIHSKSKKDEILRDTIEISAYEIAEKKKNEAILEIFSNFPKRNN